MLTIRSSSVHAPTHIWKGWGDIAARSTLDVKVCLGSRLRDLFFSPTPWPLGQNPPKVFRFRVFFLNSFSKTICLPHVIFAAL